MIDQEILSALALIACVTAIVGLPFLVGVLMGCILSGRISRNKGEDCDG